MRYLPTKRQCRQPNRGFTIAELLVVMLLLVVVAGVAMPILGDASEDAKQTAALTTLNAVRDAAVRYWADYKHAPESFADVPLRVVDLFVDPELNANPGAPVWDPSARVGWRGPYLLQSTGDYVVDTSRGFTAAFGTTGDPAVLDPWGNPVVIEDPDPATYSREIRIVSAGRNGVLGDADDISVEIVLQ